VLTHITHAARIGITLADTAERIEVGDHDHGERNSQAEAQVSVDVG